MIPNVFIEDDEFREYAHQLADQFESEDVADDSLIEWMVANGWEMGIRIENGRTVNQFWPPSHQ